MGREHAPFLGRGRRGPFLGSNPLLQKQGYNVPRAILIVEIEIVIDCTGHFYAGSERSDLGDHRLVCFSPVFEFAGLFNRKTVGRGLAPLEEPPNPADHGIAPASFSAMIRSQS